MRRTEKGFSIVDFLIIMACLLIVMGMFAPLFVQKRGASNVPSATRPAATQPVR